MIKHIKTIHVISSTQKPQLTLRCYTASLRAHKSVNVLYIHTGARLTVRLKFKAQPMLKQSIIQSIPTIPAVTTSWRGNKVTLEVKTFLFSFFFKDRFISLLLNNCFKVI